MKLPFTKLTGKSTTSALSLPKSLTVRGYEVRRLAMGEYLTALDALQSLPGELISICFPGLQPTDLVNKLRSIDEATIQGVIGHLMLSAPGLAVRLTATLTGIDEQTILTDLEIGADGMVEILAAWIEVNRLAGFPQAVRELIGSFRTATSGSSHQPITGSKG